MTAIEPLIVFLIFINSIMIGVGTFDFVDKDPQVKDAFELVDKIFLIIFTVEVVLSTVQYLRLDKISFPEGFRHPKFPPLTMKEKKHRQRNTAWLVFDLIVIILSWAFSRGSVIRAFRILRAVRLISKVKSLKNLTRALLHVCPKMGALAFITILLFVVVGVMVTLLFRDMYKDGKTEYDYFSRIDSSLLTLFQMMTFDNWHEPARGVMETYSYAWVIFVFWVFLSGFVIMNLIIAIVCESLVKLDEIGVKALYGEDVLDHSIRDIDEDSTDGQMDLRLLQLEASIDQILENELMILREIRKLKAG